MQKLQRKASKWRCKKCEQFIEEPWEPRDPYTTNSMDKEGNWTRTLMTVEMQRERALTCYDCDGGNTLTAYDVQTVAEFDALEESEQCRVLQQLDENSPRELIIHSLTIATQRLNHEDEDHIPAIKIAIGVLQNGKTS